MLIQFRVTNYRSFKDTQTLSLVASRDRAHPGNVVDADDARLLKAAAIYGPNASGKSNLVKAFDFVASFVSASATKMNLGDTIDGAVPFRLSVETRDQPCAFEVTFLLENTQYEYGFSATKQRVYDEWLRVWPASGKPRFVFERRFDLARKTTTWRFDESLAKDQQLLQQKTRDNGLLLSRGADLNVTSLTDVFLWFRLRLWVYDLSRTPASLLPLTAQRMMGNADFRKHIVELVKEADLGIADIRLVEEPVPPHSDSSEPFPLRMLTETAPFHKTSTATSVAVRTEHPVAGADVREVFDLNNDESNGTRRFFALSGLLLDALENGDLLILDELDCSIHPLLTRKTVEYFQDPSINTKGAQLIFASHDITLMSPEIFRRDQVWLVEKQDDGASELFSLYDFQTKNRPRSSEAFQRNYLAGRYGAVPRFGPIFEELGTM